jgi:hypothetical protein
MRERAMGNNTSPSTFFLGGKRKKTKGGFLSLPLFLPPSPSTKRDRQGCAATTHVEGAINRLRTESSHWACPTDQFNNVSMVWWYSFISTESFAWDVPHTDTE